MKLLLRSPFQHTLGNHEDLWELISVETEPKITKIDLIILEHRLRNSLQSLLGSPLFGFVRVVNVD